ncbi:MAG: cbb3-type cytochrome c oxidase N-terminal domain-containing protein [Psychroflexus sp.]|uniref:cbb3-type cytochrome c oxidase N-terminal domain-containing protein n=1 Tax=Psychroflexus sp. S27 TaxID=1982757 RepID=UPI000C29FE22|nr:cbb3-type cytochrome c oxidase N-terminal domain-containing protein [Psychroflexus sp. S27]PJX24545.1 cytochrome C oxidase subunit III [Psychroflexus sp. S27]
MRNTASILRIIVLVGIAFLGVEFLLETDPGHWAVVEYPKTWLFLGIVLLFAVAIEASVAALHSTLYKSLSEEKKARYHELEAHKSTKFEQKIQSILSKMTRSKSIEQEGEIELDHVYDGITELDNKLPPWWLYSFYASIVFAAIYMIRFHIYNDYTQEEEYLMEVAEAEAAIEEYKRTAKDLINFETVTLLTDASDLNEGKTIYNTNCVACHKADGGGGIGPNLTDDHWILGGGIQNVYKTISEGGRSGKGMVAWKNDLSPSEMQKTASYVISLNGTSPTDPKEAEGDIIWTPDDN